MMSMQSYEIIISYNNMFLTIDIVQLLVSNLFSVCSHDSATSYSTDHSFICILINYYFSLRQQTK